jgi:hypothetical protein
MSLLPVAPEHNTARARGASATIAARRDRVLTPMPIDPRYLFATDVRASRDDQLALIDRGRCHGAHHAGLYGHKGKPAFWRLEVVRSVDPTCLPETARRWFAAAAAPDQTFGRWAYQCRLDDSLRWRWLDDDAERRITGILAPIAPCFRLITRVNINLQIPGQDLPMHRDLVAGNAYDGLDSATHWRPGPHRLRYLGDAWLEQVRPLANREHGAAGYLAVKIPLSERDDDPGLPYIVHDNQKSYYSTDNRVFFLNEYEIYHGADPVDFWRGVVFVAGILEPARVAALGKRAVAARPA